MTLLPHLAARLFGAPLLIARPKLEVILAVLGPRIGLTGTDAAAPVHIPTEAPIPNGPPGIAVIPIHGTLVRRTLGLEVDSGLTSYQSIAAQLDAALADPRARAILLDVDSPGGEAGGVFDLADRIRAATRIKPVWAVANDLAFSAAYALASAANRVFVSRTGGVGSIGVIALHADQSEKDAQDGVRYTTVFAGAHKNDLNPHAPPSDEALATLQTEVNRVYDLFVATVAQHRGLPPERVRGTEAGLFFGQDAIAAGLADALGTREDALTQLTQTLAAGIPGRPRLSLLHEDPAMKTSPDAPTRPEPAPAPEAPPVATEAPAAASAQTLAPAAVPVPTPPAPQSAADAALEIAQTCTLAGRTDLIVGFLEAGATPARVRHDLLSLQADASPEIASRVPPATGAYARPAAPDAADNPLIQAVKRRLATH